MNNSFGIFYISTGYVTYYCDRSLVQTTTKKIIYGNPLIHSESNQIKKRRRKERKIER